MPFDNYRPNIYLVRGGNIEKAWDRERGWEKYLYVPVLVYWFVCFFLK